MLPPCCLNHKSIKLRTISSCLNHLLDSVFFLDIFSSLVPPLVVILLSTKYLTTSRGGMSSFIQSFCSPAKFFLEIVHWGSKMVSETLKNQFTIKYVFERLGKSSILHALHCHSYNLKKSCFEKVIIRFQRCLPSCRLCLESFRFCHAYKNRKNLIRIQNL